MAGAVALCMQVLRPRSHCYLFRSAYRLSQGYKLLSKAREVEESGAEYCEGIGTMESKGKKEAIFGADAICCTTIEKRRG